MIGCHLTRWVYSQHQGHHHLEHYTSAIKLASGQYLVIGPILKKCLIHFDHQLKESKAFTTNVKISAGMKIILLYFTPIYVAQYLKKNKTTVWLCIKNLCGMLVRAPEPNDKVEEVEIVSTACVGEQRCAFPPLSVTDDCAGKQPGPQMKAIPNRDHVSAEHVWPRICVMSRALGVNKQIWLTRRGGVKKEIRDLMFISLRESNCNGIHKKSEAVMWCQSAGIIHERDAERTRRKDSDISGVVL